MSPAGKARNTGAAALYAFAERAAAALRADERVRAIWLTGSLAAGTEDAWSDVDLRALIRAEDFGTVGDWWPELIERIGPTVWRRRWPGPPAEVILGAIASDYTRFDLVLASAADPRPPGAAQVLWDPDGLAATAATLHVTPPPQDDPLARLPEIVEEFIRLLGMLPIVVGRADLAIGMEGQMGAHSLLLALLLMEQGIDRAATGKRHVTVHLSAEQREALTHLPALAPTMESVIQGRLAYARLFLPRARRLMEAHGMAYPDAFERATWQHLRTTLGLDEG